MNQGGHGLTFVLGACAVDLFKHDNRCPQDRLVITGINDNRTLAQIIEQYLQAHPDEKLEADELMEMDRKYRPGQRASH